MNEEILIMEYSKEMLFLDSILRKIINDYINFIIYKNQLLYEVMFFCY